MKNHIVAFALMFTGLNANANNSVFNSTDDLQPNCGPISITSNDNGAGIYDLRKGIYDSSDKNTPWCGSYKINNIQHYSCNSNIYSFILTCNTGGSNWSTTFKCNQSGVCATDDADARTINVHANNNEYAIYSKRNGESRSSTGLRYTGPCEN
jgi:hypothetical protein